MLFQQRTRSQLEGAVTAKKKKALMVATHLLRPFFFFCLDSKGCDNVRSMNFQFFSTLLSDHEMGRGLKQSKLLFYYCKSTVWVISFFPTGFTFSSQCSMMITHMAFAFNVLGTTPSSSSYQPCDFQTSYLTPWVLSALNCNMGIIITSSESCSNEKMPIKCLASSLNQHFVNVSCYDSQFKFLEIGLAFMKVQINPSSLCLYIWPKIIWKPQDDCHDSMVEQHVS